MNVENVIFEFTPPTTSERLKATIPALCLVFLASWSVTTWKISVLFALIMGLLTNIVIWFRSSYDGWSINEKSIILNRCEFTFQPKQMELYYHDIIKIVYFKPITKRPYGIEFKTKTKTYFVRNGMDVFELADTLKYLKLKGINVKLAESDHEIELYLCSKINSIPLNNKF